MADSRNTLRGWGGDFIIEFLPDEHEPYSRRQLMVRVSSTGQALIFEDRDSHQAKILRQVEVPVRALFDFWPLMEGILQDYAGVRPTSPVEGIDPRD